MTHFKVAFPFKRLSNSLPEVPRGPHEAMVGYSGRRAGEVRQLSWRQTSPVLRVKAILLIFLPLIIWTISYCGLCWLFWKQPLFLAIMCFLSKAMAIFGIPIYFLVFWKSLQSPSHIELRKEGMRFHQLTIFGLSSSDWLPWDAVCYVASTENNRFISYHKTRTLDLHLDCHHLTAATRRFIYRCWKPLVHLLHADFWKASFLPGELVIKLDRDLINREQDVDKLFEAITAFLEPEKIDPSVKEWKNSERHDLSITSLWLDTLSGSSDSPSDRLEPLQPGAIVGEGRYRVVNRIASGGQSITYKAVETQPLVEQIKVEVVLKEFVLPLRGGLEVSSRVLKSIQAESALVSQLDHPQIVRCRETFLEGRRAYVVLNYIEGQTLLQVSQARGKIPERDCLGLVIQMCNILEYLHSRKPPVVHRDFTPDNLIFRTDSMLELIDFNVAKQLESDKATQTVVGKHAYIPPEQFRGRAAPQSDIYALGCTIFRLLTGEDPEPISVSHPKSVVPELSDAIDAFVAKATAQELSGRFGHINEVRQTIIQIQSESQSVSLAPDSLL